MGDGDRCGSCDVLVCGRCLKGTARCPSCQRFFSETRGVAPRAARRGEARLESARQETIAVAASLAVASVIIVVMSHVSVFRSLVAVAMVGLLLLQLVRGRVWARWLVAGLSGLYGLGLVVSTTQPDPGGSRLVLLGLAAVLLVDVLVLAFNGRVGQYLDAQRDRHP